MPKLSEQQISEIVAREIAKVRGASSAQFRAVGHSMLRCDQTGETIDADHPNPVAHFRSQGISQPTFSGAKTFFFVPEKGKASHHAEYIPDDHGEGLQEAPEPVIEKN